MVLSSKGKFFAIEVKTGETAHQAIGRLMHLAKERSLVFVGLELYETFKINKTGFVRVRTDLDVKSLKDVILQGGRGVIVRSDASIPYAVYLADGTTGKHSATAMHGTPRVTEHRSYRGTKDKFWDRQFEL